MANTLCALCVTNECTVKLECKFKICEDCLKDWILQRIEDSVISGEVTVPCVDTNCKHKITGDQINSYFKPSISKTEINEGLLKLYLNRTKDMRTCPKKGCSYAGYIQEKPCSQNNVCAKCDYEWKDPS